MHCLFIPECHLHFLSLPGPGSWSAMGTHTEGVLKSLMQLWLILLGGGKVGGALKTLPQAHQSPNLTVATLVFTEWMNHKGLSTLVCLPWQVKILASAASRWEGRGMQPRRPLPLSSLPPSTQEWSSVSIQTQHTIVSPYMLYTSLPGPWVLFFNANILQTETTHYFLCLG